MTNKEAIRIIKIVLAIAEDFEITVQGEELTEEKCKEAVEIVTKALEQQPSREWKEIYAESEGSNSWIEFKCPHCGYSFGMESGEYDWHYGDEIPWKYCPICGGSAEHKPYKAESEDNE